MRVLAAGVAVLALAAAPSALGENSTQGHVEDLAARAADDEEALAELRRIGRVDGRRVDLETALAGAEGEELERRLAALAAQEAITAPNAAVAREEAADILAERPFEQRGPPRPFRRSLGWLGDRLEPLARPFRWLDGWVPGGESVLWTLLGAGVIAAAASFAAWLGRRRGGTVLDRVSTEHGEPGIDPRRLDRLAAEAEQRGELELALRLRFRAGLVRLAQLRAVPRPETLTNRQFVRLLGSEQFDRLARDLDEVVYGGRTASRADLDAARSGWPRVLAEAGGS